MSHHGDPVNHEDRIFGWRCAVSCYTFRPAIEVVKDGRKMLVCSEFCRKKMLGEIPENEACWQEIGGNQ